MTSTFFCSSSCTLVVPAAPRLPDRAPEATTRLILAQAVATVWTTSFRAASARSAASHAAKSTKVVMRTSNQKAGRPPPQDGRDRKVSDLPLHAHLTDR